MTEDDVFVVTVRLIFGVVFLVLLGISAWRSWMNSTATQELLRLGQADKLARELAFKEIKEASIKLDTRTDLLAAEVKATNEQSKEHVDNQLQSLDSKMDHNTELTKAAALASAEAAEVANRVNIKIEQTNKQFEQTLAHLNDKNKEDK